MILFYFFTMSQTSVYSLPVEQLEGLKKQLDSDIQSLGAAYDGLFMGRNRFLDNAETVEQYRDLTTNASETNKMEIMACLTSSLFVRAYIVPKPRVLVDVGTGYFLEQPMNKAKEYFTARAGQIKEGLDNIERTIVNKQKTHNQVVDALRQKTAAIQRSMEAMKKGVE